MCLIFVVFDDYENFLPPKISRIMVSRYASPLSAPRAVATCRFLRHVLSLSVRSCVLSFLSHYAPLLSASKSSYHMPFFLGMFLVLVFFAFISLCSTTFSIQEQLPHAFFLGMFLVLVFLAFISLCSTTFSFQEQLPHAFFLGMFLVLVFLAFISLCSTTFSFQEQLPHAFFLGMFLVLVFLAFISLCSTTSSVQEQLPQALS